MPGPRGGCPCPWVGGAALGCPTGGGGEGGTLLRGKGNNNNNNKVFFLLSFQRKRGCSSSSPPPTGPRVKTQHWVGAQSQGEAAPGPSWSIYWWWWEQPQGLGAEVKMRRPCMCLISSLRACKASTALRAALGQGLHPPSHGFGGAKAPGPPKAESHTIPGAATLLVLCVCSPLK